MVTGVGGRRFIMRKILKILNTIEEWTLVLVLVGLALLTFVQVFSRYVLGYSFTWMEELGRYLGVFIAFLGASLGVKYGTHFSMDLVYEQVKRDRFRHGLKVCVNLICGLMFFVVAWYGWAQAMKLYQFGVRTSVLEVPKYWAYLPIPIFSIIMGSRFLRLAVKHSMAFIRKEPYLLPGQEP